MSYFLWIGPEMAAYKTIPEATTAGIKAMKRRGVAGFSVKTLDGTTLVEVDRDDGHPKAADLQMLRDELKQRLVEVVKLQGRIKDIEEEIMGGA